MTINYNVTGTERKRLADYISGFMGTEKKYLGAPTFAYQIGYLTVSKDGAVSFEDRGYNSDIDALMAELEGQGFHTEDTIAKADTAEPEATSGEDAAQPDEAGASAELEAAPAEDGVTQPHGFGLTVTLPAASFRMKRSDAEPLLRGTLSLRLEYVLDEGEKTAVLRYLPDGIHSFYVDDASGKLVDLTELYEELGRKESADAGENGTTLGGPMADAEAGSGLTQAEQLGADAVVNVRYASASIMQGAAEITVYGTAVRYQ